MTPTIQIALTPEGKVHCQFNVPNRAMFNMMIETAKQDVLDFFRKQEHEPARLIEVAPVGVAAK